MNSRELNLKLIDFFPEINGMYQEETVWQDGDETGSHVVYADVFVPFIKEQITESNEQMLSKTFDYIESLLNLNDEYANEVVALSVIETLLFDDEIDNALFIQFAKTKTLKLIEEIVHNIDG
ncbi:MAG: hypothetical protein IJ300_08935 [Clostridia bacterium]|nr:hypothetical protein [Clostridia bacterium]